MKNPSVTVTFNESSHREAQPDDRLMKISGAITCGAMKAYLQLPGVVKSLVHSIAVEVELGHDGISPIKLTFKEVFTAVLESGTCTAEYIYPHPLHNIDPEQLYFLIEKFTTSTFREMVQGLHASARKKLGTAEELMESVGATA